jgi:hypothetical protein
MSNSAERYPCPCCGYLVFDDPPGSYDICPICFWEDDAVQLRYAGSAVGANHLCLLDAQRAYAGYADEVARGEQPPGPLVRLPINDQRDAGWRLLDPDRDNVEHWESGAKAHQAWPDDLTTLYYWRDTYWRR